MSPRRGFALCGGALAFALVGCAPESIIVAYGPDADVDAADGGDADAGQLPDANTDAEAGVADAGAMGEPPWWSDAGPPWGSGTPCGNDGDCASGSFCNKRGCGPDARGTCAVPTLCSAEIAPVCGCDGVSYFNDCLRRQHRVGLASSFGECSDGSGPVKRCRPGQVGACGEDGHCAVLLFSRPCEPESFSMGKCWIIPADCSSASSGGARFQSCVSGATGERECVSPCEAIESELPMRAAGSCRDRPPGP